MRAGAALWILAGCGRIGFDTHVPADADAAYEQRITIHGAMVTESLARFTQLARPTSAIHALSFLAADHVTALDYETEATTPDAFDVWVGVPLISGETTIYVQYGAIGVLPSLATPVWDEHFVGVWHLGDARDSTLHHLDGVFTGTTAVPGIVAGARRLNHGWMTVAAAPALDALAPGTGLTVETWANAASVPALEYRLIGRETDAEGLRRLRVGLAGGLKPHGEVTDDPGDANFADHLPRREHRRVAPGRADPFAGHRLDRARAGTGPQGAKVAATGTLHADSNPVEFGADCNSCGGPPDDDFFDGVLDEARISDVARSDAWLRAEYLNLVGSFVSVGPSS